MADWHSIGAENMLTEGTMQHLELGGQELLLARVGGAYYATQGRCPHLRGHLTRGKLNGQIVTCPLHGSRFNVTTGECVAWVDGLAGLIKQAAQAISSPKNLATFPTKVQDGQLWVLV